MTDAEYIRIISQKEAEWEKEGIMEEIDDILDDLFCEPGDADEIAQAFNDYLQDIAPQYRISTFIPDGMPYDYRMWQLWKDGILIEEVCEDGGDSYSPGNFFWTQENGESVKRSGLEMAGDQELGYWLWKRQNA